MMTNRNTKENRWTDIEIGYEADNYSPSEWMEIVKTRKAAKKDDYRTWEDSIEQ